MKTFTSNSINILGVAFKFRLWSWNSVLFKIFFVCIIKRERDERTLESTLRTSEAENTILESRRVRNVRLRRAVCIPIPYDHYFDCKFDAILRYASKESVRSPAKSS